MLTSRKIRKFDVITHCLPPQPKFWLCWDWLRVYAQLCETWRHIHETGST